MFKNKKTILVICLFIALLGLKIGHRTADPPTQLSWSGGLFGDEGAHAHNARNKILFGQWITDDWNPMFYNPFLTLGEYCLFLLLGPGLQPVRLTMVIVTFCGLVLFFRALRKVDFAVALGAVILLGVNYIYLMYSRLGLTDSFLGAAFLAAFFFWQKGIEKEKILFLAGIACFATYVCKGTAVYFMAAAVISLFFALIQKNQGRPLRQIVFPLGYFFSGFILAVLLWLFLFYRPHQSYFAAYGQTWLNKALPGNWQRWWQIFSRPRIFYLAKTPLILLTSLFYLPFYIHLLFRDWRRIYPAEFFAWFWWGSGIIFLSSLNYSPLRYFTALIPAFCLVTAFALVRLLKGKVFSEGKKPGVLFWILTSLWSLAVIKMVIGCFTIRQIVSPLLFILLSVFLVFLVYYLFLEVMIFRGRAAVNFTPAKLFVLSLFLTAVLTNGYRYFDWFTHPKYTVVNTSRELGKILNKSYLAGLWAPLVCLENSHRALYLGEGNERNTFSRYPVTHLFLWDGNNRGELRRLQRDYPEVMEKAEQIKTFTIKDFPVRLFEIRHSGQQPAASNQ